MKEFLKKNFAIVLAFLLPIALITIIALSTYLPSLFLSTNYNFLYTTCAAGSSYYYSCNDYLQSRYVVANTKLFMNPVDPTKDSDKDGVLDIHEGSR